MISQFLTHARSRMAKRMKYNRLIDEIQSLTNRDLADIGGDRSDMMRQAYRDVYGR